MRLSWGEDCIFFLSDSGSSTVSCAALSQLLAFSGLNISCGGFYQKSWHKYSFLYSHFPSCSGIYLSVPVLYDFFDKHKQSNECWVGSMNIQFLCVCTLRGASIHVREDHHAVKSLSWSMRDNWGERGMTLCQPSVPLTTSLRWSNGEEVCHDSPTELHDQPVQTTSQWTKRRGTVLSEITRNGAMWWLFRNSQQQTNQCSKART